MNKTESKNDLYRIFEILWNKKWIALITFMSIFISVTLWALYQPNLYRSSATIFLESQKVPSDYVRSTVTSDLEARLTTVKQQITGRTILIKVINELNLYQEMQENNLPPEVLVARMRNDLSVETPPTRRGITPGYFQVSYIHQEPSKAMLAVSKLVTLFIEESLWIREQQASGTTSFIEDELVKLKKVLEEQEEAVREYKRMFMGELPDQLDANLRMLDNLQLQLSDNLESQRGTRDQIMLLEREISRMEGEIKVASSLAMDAETETMTNSTVNQLVEQANTLRQQIANMEVTYTENHPDLIAAKKELAGLEQKLRAVSDSISSSQETNTPGVISLAPTYSLEIANLRRQLNAMKPQVSSLRREEKDLRKKIQQYQQRIEAAPEREQNLIKLTRDYENTKTSYEDLLNKKLEAQLSENLEKRQKGANFQVVDPANFPERPFLPNRKKIIGMGFVGGLGVGIGLVFLLDMLFPVFSSLKQLQDVSEFNINFGIPYISSATERRRRMENAIVFGCAFLVVFFLSMALVDQYVFDLEMFKRTIIANLKGIV